MKCKTPKFTPHYYNLDLPSDAAQEQVKQAYRRLVRKLHPDKIRDPEQKAKAFTAIQLINEAYETLSDKDKQDEYHGICKDISCLDRINVQDSWQLEHWNDIWKEKHRRDVERKPWFWHYKPMPSGIFDNDYEDDLIETRHFFCAATWVNLIHVLVDNSLPATISDNIWHRAESWRDGGSDGPPIKNEALDFQRDCENFEVNVMVKDMAWSEIPSNTNWATLGRRSELFCPDILLLPLTLTMIILLLFVAISIKVFRYFFRAATPVFWPSSAISTPTLAGPLIADAVTHSQRGSQGSASERRSSSNPPEREYEADTETTSRYTSDPSTHMYFSAMATSGQSRPPTSRSSQKSSPPRKFPTESSSRKSALNPSQLLSLDSSEKHWYYPSEKSEANDLPLRDRRRPPNIPEPLRPRYVHYEDEEWADDEESPRYCTAQTATGKPCQRKVSITTPLSGSTVSGLISPLCFQHRNLRQWVREYDDREPVSPIMVRSPAGLPVLRRRQSLATQAHSDE